MATKFWLCGEAYRGSGRISRTWIVESEESPDKSDPCPGRPDCYCDKSEHVPYPFNGMGGFVHSSHDTEDAAMDAESSLWDNE